MASSRLRLASRVDICFVVAVVARPYNYCFVDVFMVSTVLCIIFYSKKLSLAQPGRKGGLGVRHLEQAAAAARWASAAAVVPDIEHFLEVSHPEDPPPFCPR